MLDNYIRDVRHSGAANRCCSYIYRYVILFADKVDIAEVENDSVETIHATEVIATGGHDDRDHPRDPNVYQRENRLYDDDASSQLTNYSTMTMVKQSD